MKQYSEAIKEQILKEAKDTGSVALVAKKHGVPTSTIHTWQKMFNNGVLINKSKENRSLRKKISELELENQVLKELLKKTHQVWLKE